MLIMLININNTSRHESVLMIKLVYRADVWLGPVCDTHSLLLSALLLCSLNGDARSASSISTVFLCHLWTSPMASRKEPICQPRRRGFSPWVGKIPQKRKWQPTPVFLPGKSHGQRSLGLQSMGSQRAGHDLATKQQQISSFVFLFFFHVEVLPDWWGWGHRTLRKQINPVFAPGPPLFLFGGRQAVSAFANENPGGESTEHLGPSGLSLLVSWNLLLVWWLPIAYIF